MTRLSRSNRRLLLLSVTLLGVVLSLYFFFAHPGQVLLPPQAIPPVEFPQHPLKVVLVLGAGGARGMAHVGVIEVLEKNGIPIDYIIGCSAGAIVGALYASEGNSARVKEILMPVRRNELLEISYTSLWNGLSDGSGMRRFLQEHLAEKNFSSLKIPLMVVATDLHYGQLIKINSGDVVSAVHASAALPLVFQPVTWQGRTLVDGGVLDPVPAQFARQMNTKLVIAVDVSEVLPSSLPTNLLGVAKRSMEITYAALSRDGSQYADIVIRPKVGHTWIFDDQQNEQNYMAGKHAAEIFVPVIKDRLN